MKQLIYEDLGFSAMTLSTNGMTKLGSTSDIGICRPSGKFPRGGKVTQDHV